jgi:hypothetical protein
MTRDPEPALRLIAEASQLLAKLREALPALVPEVRLEARMLITLEHTIATLSFALAVLVPDESPARPTP